MSERDTLADLEAAKRAVEHARYLALDSYRCASPPYGTDHDAYELERARRLAELEATDSFRALMAELERASAAHHRDERFRWLAGRGLPVKDVELIVDGLIEETEPCARLQASRERGDWLIAVSGGLGIGKTTALAWWLAQHRDPRFLRSRQLERMSRYDAIEMSALEQVGALGLDDLGAEFADSKGNFSSMLDGLVDARYSNGLRTAITTNLSLEQFRSSYGGRVLDRLKECGAWYVCGGPGLRKRGTRRAPRIPAVPRPRNSPPLI